jgi:hypothetical protein
MNGLKVIRKVGNTLYEVYSRTFDKVFYFLSGNPKPANLGNIYCIPNYFITPGGVIVRIDD